MEKIKVSSAGPDSLRFNFEGVDFLAYSEYAVNDPRAYSEIARKNNCYVIGGAAEERCVSSSLYGPEGQLLGTRNKTHLVLAEIASGRQPGNKIFPFEFAANGRKMTVLPILCFEVMFPEDWMPAKSKPDFVVHHVGFPMFNRGQDMDWFSMQKAVATRFKCDVIVACGYADVSGTENINNSGVVNYNSGKPERILIEQKRSG